MSASLLSLHTFSIILVVLVLHVFLLPHACQASIPILPHSLRIEHYNVDTHPNNLIIDTCTPHFSWQLTDEGIRGITQTAYQLLILTQHYDGTMLLTNPLSDSDQVYSNRSTYIQHPSFLCHHYKPNTKYEVRVKYWSSTGGESAWTAATFRTSMLDTWRDPPVPYEWIGSLSIPMHQLIKPFTLPSTTTNTITSATVQMSGIGYSTLYINGKAVDPSRVLDPGWTTYEKRTLYVMHEVHSLLQTGDNVIGVELGNGWYSQEQYNNGVQEPSYGPPRLMFWLRVLYSDNSTIDVYTNTTWLGSMGPTIHDGIYMGSILDHRWLRPTWNTIGFNPANSSAFWMNATTLPSPLSPNGIFSLQIADPIRLPPDNLHIATSGSSGNPPGVVGGDLIKQHGGVIQPTAYGGFDVQGTPFDLGQNMAGWCAIKLTGKRGQSVQVHYAETMTRSSPQTLTSLYTENLQNAASTDIFIFGEDDVKETFVPPFTQHGFRYLEVRAPRVQYPIAPEDIECYFVHSETTLVGNITMASTVMNQIHQSESAEQHADASTTPHV